MTECTLVFDLHEAEKLASNSSWSFDPPEYIDGVKTWKFYQFRGMGQFYKERIVDGQGRESYIIRKNIKE